MKGWSRLALALVAVGLGCRPSLQDDHDATPGHDAGEERSPSRELVDAGPDTNVAADSGARVVQTRRLGSFPRDIEEPDFHQYVEIPSGELSLSFTLTGALDCGQVTVEIDTHGPHRPIEVVLERASGGGATEVARESAACDGAQYCTSKLTRSRLQRGPYTVRFTSDDTRPILARIVIDTCHGLE